MSHETIYLSLFVQSRGTLRHELTAPAAKRASCDPTPAGRSEHRQGRGQITGKLLISERPAEAEDRAVPGHWEGDLFMGTRPARSRRSSSASALHPARRAARRLRAGGPCLADSIASLPEQLRRSLTWDQGKEMAEHKQFSIDSGVKVYFCDPHSPWQRGSNENTNGLLRQYFPEDARAPSPRAPRRGRRGAQRPAAQDTRVITPPRSSPSSSTLKR